MMRATVLVLMACSGDPAVDPEPDDENPPDTAATVVRDPKFDRIADRMLDALDDARGAGVSIAVMEGGELTWVEGFGSADPGGDVAIAPSTVFQIGSLTKQMTAAVVLQQVEDGILSLDAPLPEVLPSFSMAVDPSWAPAATLHLLLSHQGGLFDTIDWAGGPEDDQLATWLYGTYGPQWFPMSPPGAFYNYSNPNYALAGLAAEEHDPAGRWFADLLSEDLFAPLGLERTFVRKAEVVADGDFALSTTIDVETGDPVDLRMRDVTDAASALPVGGVWSTPTDLCRWGQFVLHGDPEILGDELRAELTTSQVSTAYYDDHYSYGYGEEVWDLYPLSDGWYPIRVWAHNGATPSFSSWLVMFPDRDAVFAILTNGYHDGAAYAEAIDELIRTVESLPAPADYVLQVEPDRLGVHLGTYHTYDAGDLVITSDGTTGLLVEMPYLTSLGFDVDPTLDPISTDLWLLTLDGVDYDLTFIRDPNDGPSLYVRNRSFVGTRDDGIARRPAPTADREQVQRYLDPAWR